MRISPEFFLDIPDLCRKQYQRHSLPCILDSRTTFRETLIGVDPEEQDLALRGWNEQFAKENEGLAVDGKTMRNAVNDEGRQTHILGVVGHQAGDGIPEKMKGEVGKSLFRSGAN